MKEKYLGEILSFAAFRLSELEARGAPDYVLQDMKDFVQGALAECLRRPRAELSGIARTAFLRAAELAKLEGPDHDLSRSFDLFDELLGVDYASDRAMVPVSGERAYAGAAARVQSSYSGLMQSLARLQLPTGARVVDLGSGYGRLGFVVGLLRPDVEFIGFELIAERVRIAQKAAAAVAIDEHVQFFAQDLSRSDFSIPAADVYYLYDPFTKETYAHVLAQIAAHCQKHNVTVLTKGHAGAWVEESLGLAATDVFDFGNLKIFRISPSLEDRQDLS